ncbi:hypothetical protein TNCV_1592621 [Trichonephila clavipes]|nr:hypothetical protein TNCV_1592621 [Trichonephila clavipes]
MTCLPWLDTLATAALELARGSYYRRFELARSSYYRRFELAKGLLSKRRVIHQVKIDPKIGAPKIAASTSNTLGRSVSAETVRRVLRKAGYNGRVARKKPLIGKRNRVKRLCVCEIR